MTPKWNPSPDRDHSVAMGGGSDHPPHARVTGRRELVASTNSLKLYHYYYDCYYYYYYYYYDYYYYYHYYDYYYY